MESSSAGLSRVGALQPRNLVGPCVGHLVSPTASLIIAAGVSHWSVPVRRPGPGVLRKLPWHLNRVEAEHGHLLQAPGPSRCTPICPGTRLRSAHLYRSKHSFPRPWRCVLREPGSSAWVPAALSLHLGCSGFPGNESELNSLSTDFETSAKSTGVLCPHMELRTYGCLMPAPCLFPCSPPESLC